LLLPFFGRARVSELTAGWILEILSGRLRAGLSKGTVRILLATLRAMLNRAKFDGVLDRNPADRLSPHLKLVVSSAARQERIHRKAMTREELAKFLQTAALPMYERWVYILFLVLARTGMRLGEALALQWSDLDLTRREIRIARALSGGRVETPKSGHGRPVDMSEQLAAVLWSERVGRSTVPIHGAIFDVAERIFTTRTRKPLDRNNVGRVFARILRRAGLPTHFSPHSLRHTYASLLLQQGESPAYVQRQLGHGSIKLTVDTYGSWLPMGNKAAVDRLDDAEWGAGGSKMVAVGAGTPITVRQPFEKIGSPGRARTCDILINSQALYRLSYRGVTRDSTYDRAGNWGEVYQKPAAPVDGQDGRRVGLGAGVGAPRVQGEGAPGSAARDGHRGADLGTLAAPAPELHLAGNPGGDVREGTETHVDRQPCHARRHVVSSSSPRSPHL
jgi:integrase